MQSQVENGVKVFKATSMESIISGTASSFPFPELITSWVVNNLKAEIWGATGKVELPTNTF